MLKDIESIISTQDHHQQNLLLITNDIKGISQKILDNLNNIILYNDKLSTILNQKLEILNDIESLLSKKDNFELNDLIQYNELNNELSRLEAIHQKNYFEHSDLVSENDELLIMRNDLYNTTMPSCLKIINDQATLLNNKLDNSKDLYKDILDSVTKAEQRNKVPPKPIKTPSAAKPSTARKAATNKINSLLARNKNKSRR